MLHCTTLYVCMYVSMRVTFVLHVRPFWLPPFYKITYWGSLMLPLLCWAESKQKGGFFPVPFPDTNNWPCCFLNINRDVLWYTVHTIPGGFVTRLSNIKNVLCTTNYSLNFKVSPLTSLVWFCVGPRWRRFHLLHCIVTYLWREPVWHFPQLMNWFDSAWKYQHSKPPVFIFFFLYTLFIGGRVRQTAACRDIWMLWLQCPLTGLWLITEMPSYNAHLMKAWLNQQQR